MLAKTLWKRNTECPPVRVPHLLRLTRPKRTIAGHSKHEPKRTIAGHSKHEPKADYKQQDIRNTSQSACQGGFAWRCCLGIKREKSRPGGPWRVCLSDKGSGEGHLLPLRILLLGYYYSSLGTGPICGFHGRGVVSIFGIVMPDSIRNELAFSLKLQIDQILHSFFSLFCHIM
ncbi:hypothetical protein AVEN_275100-1 [Araneus ventricosus]|uniref:Uncharacterized protein n=1 Tax=Araneus ventricosus TaxID=182803 RepID=A0A4Y2VE86_ARAVE|nr:hypothetical protein AVEN_275100-1 [Araneus ventricosus]